MLKISRVLYQELNLPPPKDIRKKKYFYKPKTRQDDAGGGGEGLLQLEHAAALDVRRDKEKQDRGPLPRNWMHRNGPPN